MSEGALSQVRRVEDFMCSEQVQQDGVGGIEHRVGCVECHIVDKESRNESKTRKSDWVKFPRRWQV